MPNTKSNVNAFGDQNYSKDTSCRITLFPNDDGAYGGGGRNITSFVTEVKIEEGIKQSSLLATLTIKDGVNMIDDMRISGNERIHLEIYYPGINVNKEGKVHVFYVSDVINFSRHLQVQTYQFVCISETAYISSTKTLNRSFEGGIKDEIFNILENDLGSSKSIFSEDGAGQVKGIYPNKKPMQAITWLIRSANANGTPFYFFESMYWEQKTNPERKGGFIFGSLGAFKNTSTCYGPLYYKHVPYHQTSTVQKDPNIRHIVKVSTTLGMSKFNQIPQGAYGSTFLGVDIATKEIHLNEFRYEHDADKSLQANAPFSTTNNAKFKDIALNESTKGRKFYSSINSKAFDSNIGNYHQPLIEQLGSLQKSISKDANMNHLTHEITVEGNFDMWPGRMIEIVLPKAADPDALINRAVQKDEILSGVFMITGLTHTFKDSEYMIKAACQTDSSLLDLNKPIPGTEV